MKSPIYEIKNLDGSETLVKGLLDEYGEDNDSQDTDTVWSCFDWIFIGDIFTGPL